MIHLDTEGGSPVALNPHGEIVLIEDHPPCSLPLGKVVVPHTACQKCGTILNAIGEDGFGLNHNLECSIFKSIRRCFKPNKTVPWFMLDYASFDIETLLKANHVHNHQEMD